MGIAARASVTLTRFLLSAWVGGAALFVLTSVAEQTFSEFDSVTRDHLATIRFPLYYMFGVTALAAALVFAIFGGIMNRGCLRKRLLLGAVLTLLSLAGACADYRWVYSPLQKLITPPGQSRPAEFVPLHAWSERANEIHVTLALAAALLVCWPRTVRETTGCGRDATSRPGSTGCDENS